MGTSPVTFSGSSSFSADFQKVITRAVALASLPIGAEQSRLSALSAQQSALIDVASAFSGLQIALGQVSSSVAGNSTAQVSDPKTLTASTSASALNGTYRVQVDDIGSSTTTLSSTGLNVVTDPSAQNISTLSAFTLTVNGAAHLVNPSGSSLTALASALNAGSYGVQATIVNMGSTASPDYRLSVSSSRFAPDTIQINDGNADLLGTLSTGSNVRYTVNQSSASIQSTSRQVTLSPGLTLNLLSATQTPVSITVARTSNVGTALSGIVNAYNKVAGTLLQNRGQNGGPLSGQSIVNTMSGVLRGILQYTSGTGSVRSLVDLGITADQSGHMAFDQKTLSAATPDAVQAFLGDGASSGFLSDATSRIVSLTDPVGGSLQSSSNVLQDRVRQQNSRIASQRTRVANLQAGLERRLSAADAAIAALQSQSNYFQQLFTATYGKGTSN